MEPLRCQLMWGESGGCSRTVLDINPSFLRAGSLCLLCSPGSPDGSGQPCNLLLHHQTAGMWSPHCSAVRHQPPPHFPSPPFWYILAKVHILQLSSGTCLPALILEDQIPAVPPLRSPPSTLLLHLPAPLSYHCREVTLVCISPSLTRL